MPDRAQPPDSVALFQEALRLQAQGRKLEAARCYSRALHADPRFFEAAFNLGLLFQELGQGPEAIASYRQALAARPDYAPAWSNLGVALRNAGQLGDAVECLEQARRLAPGTPSVLNNLGLALRAARRHAEAVSRFSEALARSPGEAETLVNLATALRELGRLAEAGDCLAQAIARRPDFAQAHWDLAFLWLLQGDLRRGFAEYEWRWRRRDSPPRRFDAPPWQGEDLAHRRVLVYAEQGAGDAIQFVRFVQVLAARGAEVLLECPPSLTRLFASVAGASQVISKGALLPAFDFQVPLLSLPFRLNLDWPSLPARVPYLQPPPEAAAPLPGADASGAQFKVGLLWQGNPQHKNDAWRSLPLALLEPLLATPGAAFYSLQVPAPPTLPLALVDLSPRIRDFADTAVLVGQLDLVISVDTAVAHLAGALAREVWVLLPFAPDWRWLLGRPDSPWYPTLRLFRQPSLGDWPAVIEEVRMTLRPRVAA